MLRFFYLLLDTARGYRLTQVLGRPTIRRYETLVREHIPRDPARHILEIGCGIGSAREWFAGNYTGIDINPDYIRRARRKVHGNFQVTDAARMSFTPNAFDDAVSIATAHHLSDEELSSMVRGATIAASTLHIIDAILPILPNHRLKKTLFQMDRGRHVRTFAQLHEIVSRNARVDASRLVQGPLHDICYIRASRNSQSCEGPLQICR
jgi:SAM-dependent methyltransferase